MSANTKRVVIAGDWHGNTEWALKVLRYVAAEGIDTVLHLGDFGLWPGASGAKYLRKVDWLAEQLGLTLLVTPGNHEDYGKLMSLWAEKKHQDADGNPQRLRLGQHGRVVFLPRGWRFEIEGRSFVSLGGAVSVDRAGRTPGQTWWSSEEILDVDVEATVKGGYSDVMLLHETPDRPYAVSEVEAILENDKDYSWPPASLRDSAVSRMRATRALEAVCPRLVVHGHMHVSGRKSVRLPDAGHDTEVVAFDADPWGNGGGHNVGWLWLDDLRVEWTDIGGA